MNPLFASIISFFALHDGNGAGGGGGGAAKKTDDEVLEEKVLRMVNAAVTSQLSRKLESSVTAAVTAAIAPVLEQLQAPPPAGAKPKPDEDSPAMAELRAQVTALTSQISEKDTTAAASTKKHREEQLMAEIREGLGKAGVKPELMDGAALTVRARMTIDPKTGAATYRKQHTGWHEDLDSTAGLKDWADSDSGKAHLAPVAGGGAGTHTPAGGGTGRSLNPATLPQDPAARAKVIKAHKIAEARKSLRENAVAMVGGGRIQLGGSADPAPE